MIFRKAFLAPLLLGLCLFSLIIIKMSTLFNAGVGFAASAAFIANVIPISIVQFNLLSPITLFSISNIIFFPIAAFMNLLLESPAVREDLWGQTETAMWGSAIGALFLAVGIMLDKYGRSTSAGRENHTFHLIPTKTIFNICLFSMIFLVFMLKMKLGLYYHASIMPFTPGSNTYYLNILEHLTWIAYSGILLQVYRYTRTKYLIDGFFSLIMVGVSVALFLPSGARFQAFGFVPLLLISYLSWDSRRMFKILTVSLLTFFIVLLAISVDAYRTSEDRFDLSLIDSLSLLKKTFSETNAAISSEISSDAASYVIVQRISDFVAVGRIIETTPKIFPYRFFDDLENSWQILLPGLLRPGGSELDFNEGAKASMLYGISPGWWSSTPIMLIGDLFSRFGWVGIMFGMILLGITFSKLERVQYSRRFGGYWGFFIFALMTRIVWQMNSFTLLLTITLLTRELLIILIISAFLANIASKQLMANFYAKN